MTIEINASNIIQKKINELEEDLKKNTDSLNELETSLNKVVSNRTILQNYINQITVAIQVYKECIKVITPSQQELPLLELEPVD